MRVAEHHADQIQVLALCGPALYPEAAWSATHFGALLREAISPPSAFCSRARWTLCAGLPAGCC